MSLKEIDQKFDMAIDALVQSYDEHMKKAVPKPQMLPLRLSVVIQSKNNLRLDNIHVKQY